MPGDLPDSGAVELTFRHRGRPYRADAGQAVSLAIELDFDGEQPVFFGVSPATAEPLVAGDFTGRTAHGGSCNVSEIRMIPHCHGTHTESIAHMVEGQSPPAPPTWMPARIVTIDPVALDESGETYPAAADGREPVISRRVLEAFDLDCPALIIRTGNEDRSRQRYEGDNPHPYFTVEAVEWLVGLGVDHLLVDTPSIDRGHDDGTLPAHRAFWSLDEQRRITDQQAAGRTITEFIQVPTNLGDGLYLLNLQLPAWRTDAVPSRPVVFPAIEPASGDN